jgi:putative FmdB family regulatory protein
MNGPPVGHGGFQNKRLAMPLFEYSCEKCRKKFEQIGSSTAETEVLCPGCGSKSVQKLISRFAVAGQGDQREGTQHGCHDCHVGHKHGKD